MEGLPSDAKRDAGQDSETSSPRAGEVIEVRRKLTEVPKNRQQAVQAVKDWRPQREGRDGAELVGEAVVRNLAGRNVVVPRAILEKGWSAEPRKAGGWVVSFRFLSGGQLRTAEWVVDDVRREVRAANEVAAELEWVDPAGMEEGSTAEGQQGSQREEP